MRRVGAIAFLLVASLAHDHDARAQAHAVPKGPPDAIVDLATPEGARNVGGTWRFKEARIVAVDHRAPGPDLKPSGGPIKTHDIEPKAGRAGFDATGWERIDAATLTARRSTGRLSFAWYLIDVTIPERVGELDTRGASVVFEIVVDDYAEVWVDGRLPAVLGSTGGALVAGFNAPNRVLLDRGVRPGQSFRIAVFAANGPLSEPPGNFIWVRSATLDFYRAGRLESGMPVESRIERLDPSLDALVPRDATIEKLAGGFHFIEGPVWMPDGYLLFSDPDDNTIYRYAPPGEVSIFRAKSGYSGPDIGRYHQPGSNGLALDPEGRLTVCEHGNRRVTRIEKNGVVTVLADRYQGKRLNSPNDLTYRSDGTLYFTDPPFGLPKVYDDPAKELPYSGIFRLSGGKLELLHDGLAGPNGLAFSPDERWLYVDNWDPRRKVVMRFAVHSDGSLGEPETFFDMTEAPGEEALDGLKVDRLGNLYVSGPGGVWVLSPEGRHLGTIVGPELPANFAFGDDDGMSLYMTARTGLYRLRLGVGSAEGSARAARARN